MYRSVKALNPAAQSTLTVAAPRSTTAVLGRKATGIRCSARQTALGHREKRGAALRFDAADWRKSCRGLDGPARACASHPALAPAYLQRVGATLAPEFAVATIALTGSWIHRLTLLAPLPDPAAILELY